jgi:hypothetical protein
MAIKTDFTDLIQRRFPTDQSLGFFTKPHLPPNRLSRVLSAFTRINVGDVQAFHQYDGIFSSGSIAFTADTLWYDKGPLPLVDIKSATAQKEFVEVGVNQNGQVVSHRLKTESPAAAQLLAKFLYDLAYAPKADAVVELKKDYSAFSPEAIPWLELRDEILYTIDQLSLRFQEGKLTLMEYEEKKTDLLARL